MRYTDIPVRFDKDNRFLYTAADYVNLCLKTADGYRKAWEDEKKTKESASFMLLRKPEKGGDLW